MNISLSQLMLGYIGLVLLYGCTGAEEKAQQLLAEATQLVRSAQAAEKTSYSAALPLYQEALTTAKVITTKYPSSQLAETLAQDEVKVGPYTFTELECTVLPRAKLRAEAEDSPLACALLVTKAISEPISRTIAVADIATKYADGGQHDQVLQIVKMTEEAESKSRVLSEIVSKYLDSGQYSQALRIANAVEDASLRDWALAWIAREAVGRGDYDQALEAATSIEVAESKAEILLSVADVYARAEQKEKAAQTLSQAFQLTKKTEDVWLLDQIANRYADMDQYDQAIEVARMEDASSQARTLVEIARKRTECGQYSDALQVANMIQDPYFKDMALAEIGRKQVECGQDTPALQIVDTIGDPGFKATVLSTIAGKYAAAGHYDQAFQIANTISQAAHRADALAAIARQYAEVGQYEQAQKTANLIQDPRFREMVGIEITNKSPAAAARQAAETQERQRAEQEWRQQDPDEQAKELVDMTRQHAEAGNYDQALAVAKTISESFYQTQALAIIASKYIELGQYDHALELTATMENGPKVGLLTDLAFKYAESGAQDKALAAISQALQIAPTGKKVYDKADILAAIAEALAAVGVQHAKTNQQVDDRAKAVLHEIIAKLDESVWREPSSEAQEQKTAESQGHSDTGQLFGLNPGLE